MNRQEFIDIAEKIFATCPGNIITREIAITPELTDMMIFDTPLTGIARADDEIFTIYKDESIIGSHYLTPKEWLPSAKSVVSIFFPFTERIRKAERFGGVETSNEWLHGRVEGQNFITSFTRELCSWLGDHEIENCAPSIDERFKVYGEKFTSNWSERHAAYACGLGTFSLCRGIITKRGMAGRLSSVIINLELEPDSRAYKLYDEYCIKCGVCAKRCPANAISFEHGKNHVPCSERLNMTRKKYAPRYGCGKCQTAVPCEFRPPKSI